MSKARAFMTLFSGFITHLIVGSVYSLTLCAPYLLSYLKSFDDSIHVDDGFWFTPITLLSTTFIINIGSLLELYFPPRM